MNHPNAICIFPFIRRFHFPLWFLSFSYLFNVHIHLHLSEVVSVVEDFLLASLASASYTRLFVYWKRFKNMYSLLSGFSSSL